MGDPEDLAVCLTLAQLFNHPNFTLAGCYRLFGK
jgi:hypothetical protein